MIVYIDDNDIEFLGKVRSEDLNNLVYCLTKGRLTEELAKHELYRQYYPDHHKYWQFIAAEIQRFGANTFSTSLRGGKGVQYKEVLTDVCDKMKVNYNKQSSVEKIEDSLLVKSFENLADALKKMSPEELKKFAQSIGEDNDDFATIINDLKRVAPEILLGLIKTHKINFRIINNFLEIMNNKYAQGILFGKAFSVIMGEVMGDGLAGPIGWALGGLLAVNGIAGPAYGVTIPAVINVAVLRKEYLY